MADTKTTEPAQISDDDLSADAELADIERQMNTPDAAIERLRGVDPQEALAMDLERQKTLNARLLARQRDAGLKSYREKLAEEFPFAPGDEIIGSSRQEMRSRAQRMHRANEAIVQKAVSAALAQNGGAPAGQQDGDQRVQQWGAPPSAAATTVDAEPQVTWDQVRAKAMTGDKDAVMAEIRKNGAKIVPQETFALKARQAQQAK